MSPEGTIPGWSSYKFHGGDGPLYNYGSGPRPTKMWLVLLGVVLVFSVFLGIISIATKLAKPKLPVCKVCHCGQISCHRDCGEENMCMLRCEGLCQKKIGKLCLKKTGPWVNSHGCEFLEGKCNGQEGHEGPCSPYHDCCGDRYAVYVTTRYCVFCKRNEGWCSTCLEQHEKHCGRR